MHKSRIIGISGQMNAGKDTVANYLCEEYNFVKVALADPIKRFGYHVFHFTVEQLWGPSECRNAPDVRYNKPEAWDEAQGRVEAWGKEFVTGVLGNDDPDAVAAAQASLVRWFFFLRNSYPQDLSPRIMLQTLGTEWGRDSVHPDVWMNMMLRTAKTLLHEDGNTKSWDYDALEGCIDRTKMDGFLRQTGPKIVGVIVSDIRFENEFKRIRSEGGSVIRVIRPDTDTNAATIGIEGHASEAHDYSFDNFDFIVSNDKSLVDLYRAIDTYIPIFLSTHH